MHLLSRRPSSAPVVPTAVEITTERLERAAMALMACEAEQHLTDCYGKCSRARATQVAQAVLEAALDLRFTD